MACGFSGAVRAPKARARSTVVSSIGVAGTRAFCKNDLIPTQLHTTLHLMASIFLISYFRLPTFGLIFLEIYMFYISANLCRGEAEWIQRKIYFGNLYVFYIMASYSKWLRMLV